MRVRAMNAEDIDRVVALSNEAFPHEHEVALRFDRASLETEIARPIARLYVLEEADALSGFFTGWLVAGELQVLAIGVASAARNRRLGTVLLAAVIRETIREGMTTATLELRADNTPALALYRRHGFVEVGRRERYYADGCDAVLMQLDVAG